MANEFQLQGLDEALKKLRSLKEPKKVKASVRSAGTKAMAIVRNAARQGAARLDDPLTASKIYKEITTQYSAKRSKGSQVVVRVGVRGGAKPLAGVKGVTHWKFLEFGTSKMAAQPFMRPALSANYTRVADAFVKALEPAIDKQIAKA